MIYTGINYIARNTTNMYVGVNNIARKVSKGYVGVNNVARLFYNADKTIEYNGWVERDVPGFNYGGPGRILINNKSTGLYLDRVYLSTFKPYHVPSNVSPELLSEAVLSDDLVSWYDGTSSADAEAGMTSTYCTGATSGTDRLAYNTACTIGRYGAGRYVFAGTDWWTGDFHISPTTDYVLSTQPRTWQFRPNRHPENTPDCSHTKNFGKLIGISGALDVGNYYCLGMIFENNNYYLKTAYSSLPNKPTTWTSAMGISYNADLDLNFIPGFIVASNDGNYLISVFYNVVGFKQVNSDGASTNMGGYGFLTKGVALSNNRFLLVGDDGKDEATVSGLYYIVDMSGTSNYTNFYFGTVPLNTLWGCGVRNDGLCMIVGSHSYCATFNITSTSIDNFTVHQVTEKDIVFNDCAFRSDGTAVICAEGGKIFYKKL